MGKIVGGFQVKGFVFLLKMKVEVIVLDLKFEVVLFVIIELVKMGEIGDGKIFILEVVEVI